MYKKLKSLLSDDHLFTSVLLCFVALTAFLLGRSSVLQDVSRIVQPASVQLQTSLQKSSAQELAAPINKEISPLPSEMPGAESIVASKSGTKYHLLTCPGAKQIKEENRVYFSTSAEAEAAGYSKAANCPGL